MHLWERGLSFLLTFFYAPRELVYLLLFSACFPTHRSSTDENWLVDHNLQRWILKFYAQLR